MADEQLRSMDGQDAVTRIWETVEAANGFVGYLPPNPPVPDWGFIRWQTGPIQENGRNGILFEELLEWVIMPRLAGYNRPTITCYPCEGTGFATGNRCNGCGGAGEVPNPFRNRETSLALTALEEALLWQKRRTELRRRQGVEGTYQPHRS